MSKCKGYGYWNIMMSSGSTKLTFTLLGKDFVLTKVNEVCPLTLF